MYYVEARRIALSAQDHVLHPAPRPTLDQRIDEVSEKVKVKTVESLLESYAI